MAAFDKARRVAFLLDLGWTEAPDDPEHGPWRLRPPDDLWTRRLPDFYVYDAVDIQALLTGIPVVPEEEA